MDQEHTKLYDMDVQYLEDIQQCSGHAFAVRFTKLYHARHVGTPLQ